jgi:lipopolysaccharide assembly outer membrane protein LptD (OstA)
VNYQLSTNRKLPFTITYPESIKHRIEFEAIYNWDFTNYNTKVDNNNFDYESSFVSRGNKLNIEYLFRAKKEIVDAQHVNQVIEDFNEIYNHISYTVEYPSAKKQSLIKETSWFSTLNLIDGIFMVLIVAFGILFLIKNKLLG